MTDLASAVRRLGPERCAQALAAYDSRNRGGWHDCPLALAYGPPRELEALLPLGVLGWLYDHTPRRLKPRAFVVLVGIAVDRAAKLTGLSFEEAMAITTAFDYRNRKLHDLLEAEAAKAGAALPRPRPAPGQWARRVLGGAP